MGVGGGQTETLRQVEVSLDIDHLIVREGPDSGREFPLDEGTRTVGSSPAATVRLSDPRVSRLHCEIARMAGGVRVRDLGSKNGTWVSGCRIFDALITGGVHVQIGETVFQVETRAERRIEARWAGGDRFGELIGASPAMQALFSRMARAADGDATALVRGESGTGKELVARALHALGPRAARPFVVLDAASLSRTLAESELFGHVRGAFTGAHTDRSGVFERAHTGTLFIDELGDIPSELQSRFLRALDARSVRRIGDSSDRGIDVRIIAATHRPLETMVNEGTFREDLLYRLRVIELHVPPLRERGGDIDRLAHHFLASDAGPVDGEVSATLSRALSERRGYRWPGNVRELRNLVQRVIVLGDAAIDATSRSDIPHSVEVDRPFTEAKERWNEAFERHYLTRLLDETGGNVSEAARRAGLSRVHLTRLVARYGLRRPD